MLIINKFKDYFICNLCKKEINGSQQLQQHLMGSRHTNNKLKEKLDITLNQTDDKDNNNISQDLKTQCKYFS